MTSISAPPDPRTEPHAPTIVPRVGVLESALRHWPFVLVPLVLLVAAAFALGTQRDPLYRSETRMTVGGIDVSQPGALSGLAIAGEALATTYSRAIDAEAVVLPVARELRRRPGAIRNSVTATPVPDSPVFRIRAEAASGRVAERTADAVAASLTRYVASVSRPGERSADLFSAYRRAARTYYDLQQQQKTAEERFDENETEENRRALVDLRSETNAARVRLDGLQDNYMRSITARAASPGLQQLSPATRAVSDRRSKLELYLFVGALSGLAVGVALASLRANRLMRRRFSTG